VKFLNINSHAYEIYENQVAVPAQPLPCRIGDLRQTSYLCARQVRPGRQYWVLNFMWFLW